MESKKDNDLFFLCSFIEYIARKTKNTKKDVVEKIGKEKLEKIYYLADVYHSENIDKVSDEIIKEFNIKESDYDILAKTTNERPPSFWDIGRVYQNLILLICKDESEYIPKMIEVLTSWIIPHIDNYDSSLYYENPDYIRACYIKGEILP